MAIAQLLSGGGNVTGGGNGSKTNLVTEATFVNFEIQSLNFFKHMLAYETKTAEALERTKLIDEENKLETPAPKPGSPSRIIESGKMAAFSLGGMLAEIGKDVGILLGLLAISGQFKDLSDIIKTVTDSYNDLEKWISDSDNLIEKMLVAAGLGLAASMMFDINDLLKPLKPVVTPKTPPVEPSKLKPTTPPETPKPKSLANENRPPPANTPASRNAPPRETLKPTVPANENKPPPANTPASRNAPPHETLKPTVPANDNINRPPPANTPASRNVSPVSGTPTAAVKPVEPVANVEKVKPNVERFKGVDIKGALKAGGGAILGSLIEMAFAKNEIENAAAKWAEKNPNANEEAMRKDLLPQIKKIVNDSLASVAGGMAGTAIGSIVGPIGAALGAAAGSAAASFIPSEVKNKLIPAALSNSLTEAAFNALLGTNNSTEHANMMKGLELEGQLLAEKAKLNKIKNESPPGLSDGMIVYSEPANNKSLETEKKIADIKKAIEEHTKRIKDDEYKARITRLAQEPHRKIGRNMLSRTDRAAVEAERKAINLATEDLQRRRGAALIKLSAPPTSEITPPVVANQTPPPSPTNNNAEIITQNQDSTLMMYDNLYNIR